MTTLIRIGALALAISAGTAAHAMQDTAPAAATLKAGAVLRTADGKRLGRIDRVVMGADGSPERVGVINDSRFVYIPASTLSAADDGFVTSLTRAEVRKLK